MNKYSHALVLIGGIIAFFGFGLPWNSDETGADIANSGGDAHITIVFIAIFVLLISSIYILKRNSNKNYFLIIIILIVSSIIYLMITSFLFGIVLVGIFDIIRFSTLGAFFVMLLIYIPLLGIVGVCVYMRDQSFFQRYWRYVVGLFLGSVSLVLGFFLVIEIIDSSRFSSTSHWIGINFIIIAFIAAITTITVSIYRLIHISGWKSWSTFFVLFSCSVGLLCFLILFLGAGLNWKIDGDYLDNPQYGAFLSAVGYILSMVGVFCSYETVKRNESDIPQQEEAHLEGENESS